jgi:hypothetical protein
VSTDEGFSAMPQKRGEPAESRRNQVADHIIVTALGPRFDTVIVRLPDESDEYPCGTTRVPGSTACRYELMGPRSTLTDETVL